MKIGILGLGHVGLTSAGCLAQQGHSVVGVDHDRDRVAELLAGRCPIGEPGLEDLLQAAIRNGRLVVVADADALVACDVVIVSVGTPSKDDGSHDLGFVVAASRRLAEAVRRSPSSQRLTIVYRSTMWPGSIEGTVRPIFANEIGQEAASRIELVYNPEFLRKSTAIDDYFNPARIVIGTADGAPPEKLRELYGEINAPIFFTSFAEAEMIKLVDNGWHALKVAFANEMGRICVQLGISPARMHEIFVSDTKLNISASYTRPGGPFGGPCLPKDLRALVFESLNAGVVAPMVASVTASNEAHKQFLFAHCTKGLGPGAHILLIGLAFKSGSDDLRESPKIELAVELIGAGFKLSIHDPSIQPDRLARHIEVAKAPLPNFTQMLVTSAEMVSSRYDVVIDTIGYADRVAFKGAPVVDIHHLS